MRVKKDPIKAPRIPANSGSRESPLVKNTVLKRLSSRPSATSLSNHRISWSETRRSDSGSDRSGFGRRGRPEP